MKIFKLKILKRTLGQEWLADKIEVVFQKRLIYLKIMDLFFFCVFKVNFAKCVISSNLGLLNIEFIKSLKISLNPIEKSQIYFTIPLFFISFPVYIDASDNCNLLKFDLKNQFKHPSTRWNITILQYDETYSNKAPPGKLANFFELNLHYFDWDNYLNFHICLSVCYKFNSLNISRMSSILLWNSRW